MRGLDPFKGYMKKVNAQLEAEAKVRARRVEAADAVASKQLSDIRAQAPVDLPPELKAALPPAGAAVVKRSTQGDGYGGVALVGGVALLGVVMYLGSRQ